MEKVLNKYNNGNVTIFNSKYDESIDYGISNIKLFNLELKYQDFLRSSSLDHEELFLKLYNISNSDSYIIVWVQPKLALELGSESIEGWRFISMWISGPDSPMIGLLYRKESGVSAYHSVADRFIVGGGSGTSSSKICSLMVSLCGYGDSILDIRGGPSSKLPAWASRGNISYYGFVSDDDMYKETVAKASQLEIPSIQIDLIS